MAAVTQDGPNQFVVRFAALARGRLARLLQDRVVQVDPYLVGRALVRVMRTSTVRAASGRRLLWNEYRVILSRDDFEPLRALTGALDRDLGEALGRELKERDAELVGPLRIHLVVDEADELRAGEAVVRVGFAPKERSWAADAGELTIGLAAWTPGHPVAAPPTQVHGERTVYVTDAAAAALAGCTFAWPGGEGPIPAGVTVVLGRPHASAPAHFLALTGASPRVNKQHAWIRLTAEGATVGRFSKANPVHVDGKLVPAGSEVSVPALPAEISLSHGDLVGTLRRG